MLIWIWAAFIFVGLIVALDCLVQLMSLSFSHHPEPVSNFVLIFPFVYFVFILVSMFLLPEVAS